MTERTGRKWNMEKADIKKKNAVHPEYASCV